MTEPAHLPTPIGYANAEEGIAHVFVTGYETQARIGVYAEEQGRLQPIRISVDVAVRESAHLEDRIETVLCYHKIVKGIEAILAIGHVGLVETLADRIAQLCLADHRAVTVRVRVEKLAAISAAESVGVEIERTKSSSA